MGQGKIALWVAVLGVLGIVAAALLASGIGSEQRGGPGSRVSQGGRNGTACQNRSSCASS
ncbi:MAG TPA: hypothetical protein VGX23_22085 [Actinocrinis sp.]|nr:hypothetical protein [Actinocrinis sp.]